MKKTWILFIGLLSMFLTMYYLCLWFILASAHTGSFEDLKTQYMTYYPQFIEEAPAATFLNIIACSISSLCFGFLCTHENHKAKRVVYLSLMILNIILFWWWLWSLM